MMVKQRENFKVVILEPAKTRIANNQCPSCGKPKEQWTRRRDWACCSRECTRQLHQYYYIFGWPDLRMKAFVRDNHTCRKCGKVPEVIIKDMRQKEDGGWETYDRTLVKGDGNYHAYLCSQLVGDHIIPIALGGEEWDINNVQTLCKACNKIKTKEDAGKIAELRRSEKVLINGQQQL